MDSISFGHGILEGLAAKIEIHLDNTIREPRRHMTQKTYEFIDFLIEPLSETLIQTYNQRCLVEIAKFLRTNSEEICSAFKKDVSIIGLIHNHIQKNNRLFDLLYENTDFYL